MKHILLPSLLLAATLTNAQNNYVSEPTADALEATATADLAALNGHFAGAVKFRIDKHQRLVADYISGGNTYRTDIAHFDFLDAGTCAYDAEAKTLVLACQDPRSKCIDQEMRNTGVNTPTGRMELPVPANDPSGVRASQLLAKLVETKQSEEFARLAEVNTRTGSKK